MVTDSGMYTEKELLKHLRNKDPEAIKYFIGKYRHYLYTICNSVLKNKEESEEATQDSFLKILKAIKDYSPKGKVSTWMYTVAYRTALDYLKKRKRTEEISSDLSLHVDSPSEDFINKEKSDQIRLLINKLSPDDAGLVRLFYMEEMSVKELSVHLKLTESNIKIKLYRARKSLLKLALQTNYFSDCAINL